MIIRIADDKFFGEKELTKPLFRPQIRINNGKENAC